MKIMFSIIEKKLLREMGQRKEDYWYERKKGIC